MGPPVSSLFDSTLCVIVVYKHTQPLQLCRGTADQSWFSFVILNLSIPVYTEFPASTQEFPSA